MPRKNHNAPICIFYQRGACNKGYSCKFSHANVVSDEDRVLCAYHVQGKCRYGDHCQLLHGNICTHCNRPTIHPYNPSHAEAHIKFCKEKQEVMCSLPADVLDTSQAAECGICLENVMAKERKFGLMTGCDHAFCLNCIVAWRSKSKDVSNASTMVKSCPTCRRESLYIIPSAVFCATGDHKTNIISQYKDSLRNTPCKYFTRMGTCPFGVDCFFAHLDEYGEIVDSSEMKNIVKNRPAQNTANLPFGADIIDLLSHVTNMHPSNVMDLLMDLLVEEYNEWELDN